VWGKTKIQKKKRGGVHREMNRGFEKPNLGNEGRKRPIQREWKKKET